MRWALVPAGIFAILALSFGFQATRAFEVFELAWPAAIILLGVYLLWREGTRRRQPGP
jgi:ABC-type nickel/cobalt efflux system permease component RcnA